MTTQVVPSKIRLLKQIFICLPTIGMPEYQGFKKSDYFLIYNIPFGLPALVHG